MGQDRCPPTLEGAGFDRALSITGRGAQLLSPPLRFSAEPPLTSRRASRAAVRRLSRPRDSGSAPLVPGAFPKRCHRLRPSMRYPVNPKQKRASARARARARLPRLDRIPPHFPRWLSFLDHSLEMASSLTFSDGLTKWMPKWRVCNPRTWHLFGSAPGIRACLTTCSESVPVPANAEDFRSVGVSV